MPYTNQDYLPSYEELTVPELEVTSAIFRSAAHHLGKYCDNACKEFMLCKKEENDPRKCLNEGKEVTRCGFEFFGLVKRDCAAEFNQYMQCVDHSGRLMDFKACRKTQATFDNCMKEKLGQERPDLGYFSKVRLHKTARPKPVPEPHIIKDPVPDPPNYEDLRKPTDKFKRPHLTGVI